MQSEIFNYADDNTLSHRGKDRTAVITAIENDTKTSTDWFTENYMEANHDKFQCMLLSKDASIGDISFNVCETHIQPVDNIKILGVTLDKDLKFNDHVSKMCKKASRQLNALRRLSKHIDESCRLAIYKSFITSVFEYSPVAWIFCGKRNGHKLERLQERALRFIYKDSNSTYSVLLEKSNMMPLSHIRLKYLAIECYKCVNGMNPQFINDLFCVKEQPYNLRDPSLVVQPKYNTYTFGFRSFRYYGPKLWNALPVPLKAAPNLVSFKASLIKWLGTSDADRFVIF